MFHSKHTAALLHASARAVSGGPVYVSDRPGHHDFALLRRLVLPDGSVLRCRLPGRPTADCLFCDVSRDGTTALKVWNMNAVTGVVGVFNVQGSAFSRPHRAFRTHDGAPKALTARVAPGDVPELRGASDLFALYSDQRRALSVVDAAGGGVEVEVAGGGGCDLITVSPIARAGGVLFAPVGLVDMLNCGGAVLASALEEGGAGAGAGAGAAAALRVKGGGQFLAFASHRPAAVEVGGAAVEFGYHGQQLTFAVAAEGSATSECTVRF
jgi:raffinose synthase